MICDPKASEGLRGWTKGEAMRSTRLKREAAGMQIRGGKAQSARVTGRAQNRAAALKGWSKSGSRISYSGICSQQQPAN
jgi:hypothetical protein